MINLFAKLEKEKLLKEKGSLLVDLGCGNGKVSEPFFKAGYEVTLVDKDPKVLQETENNFRKIKEAGFQVINTPIEGFEFNQSYDGIILSNVLPFQKSKENIAKIINDSWNKLNHGGFLFFTLFGVNDQWAKEYAETMTFYEKGEALSILKDSPHYVSEDYGQGSTMKGDIKLWHIFSVLYIK